MRSTKAGAAQEQAEAGRAHSSVTHPDPSCSSLRGLTGDCALHSTAVTWPQCVHVPVRRELEAKLQLSAGSRPPAGSGPPADRLRVQGVGTHVLPGVG